MVEGVFLLRLERYTAVILRYRWLVVALATLVMLALTAGVRFITVTNDYRILFGEDNPQLLAFDALENTYSASNTALIAIAPRDGSVFTREALGAVEELTEAAWRAPYSSRVNSLTNYTHSEALDDDLVVAPLVDDASSLSDVDVVRIEKIALDAIEIAGRLVSHDRRTAGVAINFILPKNHDQAVIEITDYLDSILSQARTSHPDIDYYLTGDVVMHRTFADVTKSDMETLTPVVFLIIVGATIILLRSILSTLAIVAVIVFVINTTMGFAGWNGVVFSPTNAGVPIIVMVIAIADSIHIVTSVLLGMRRGLDRNAAIVESIRINAYPIFITSVTTAIGFLSLNASDSPPFHILGNYVAFGVLCALVYTMTLLPALLSILPLRASLVQSQRTAFFDRFADFVIARRNFLLWFVTAVVVVLILGVSRIELSDNMAQYFDDRYEFRRDTDYIIDNLTGLDKLEYSLSAGREGGITDPEYLRQVDAFAEWYRAQPEVTHVQAFSDIMKRLNKNMHGDDPAFYRLPKDPDLAAQYLLLYEFSLPFGSDLNDRIDVAKSATRLSVVTRNAWSRDLRELDKRAQVWLQANAPAFAHEASGLSIVFAHLSLRNINSMLRGTITAMALISFILIWIFKSVRVGLLSLLPNFIPAIMSFGLWGYLVGHVGIASSVVIAVVFGIVVDDTIHFLSKYLKARRDGLPAPEAVRYTFNTVGHALWTTTAVLSVGFLVFATSGFEVSWALGLLVTITIVFALVADFLLLPTLLIAIDRRNS
ncbi:MAG: MMPL family transporter [Gemmatimonadetes bacterium]|nr:MMPL family transporter [Gemmatimonadota bacterium]MYF75710.1 MMPL family transporter [Gemmatimonadota bacterium]MYK52335.1 MMPL family transporter [Gemmatimonadota bacterium]